MEFRKCPACQASVLDDDAAECPFCGASMSGKPATPPTKAAPRKPVEKSAAQSPSKPASPASGKQATAGKTTGKAASGKQLPARTAVAEKSASADDDPFDVDTSAVAQAPPMAPRPAKGRMIRIVCPMCETPGFISPKMQGRDVKCCNRDCLVPVFKAPRPERKAAPDDESGSGTSVKILWGLVAGGLIVVLGLASFFVLRDSGPSSFVPPDRPVAGTQENESDGEATGAETATSGVSAARPRISLSEIQRRALEQSVQAARRRENRSKPYCRRMAAEAYAELGMLKEAHYQIERLQAVTPERFYRVEPLVEIAWQQLAAGDRAAAERTIEEAFAAAVDLPPVGRAPVVAVSTAGAALTSLERIEDAREVVSRLNRDDEAAIAYERVAALTQFAYDLRIFDLDRMLRFSSLDMAAEPTALSVATGAAAKGFWQQAISWSLAAEDVVKQEDCLAAVAVVAGWHAATADDAAPVSLVTQAGTQLSTAGQSRVAAGVATGYLLMDDREGATAALDQAVARLDEVPRPPVIPSPSVKRIHDAADDPNYNLPDSAPLRSAAIGAAQIARLQVLLGNEQAAWTTFLRVWQFTAGMGPEWETTSELAREIDNRRSRAEQRIRHELGISNRDLAERAFSRYARSGRRWGEAADDRFNLEVALLKEAITWGLLDNVAAFLKEPTASVPSATGQPYRSTYLATTLAEAYAAVGDDAQSSEAAALASGANVAPEKIAPLIAETERLFRANKHTEAAQALSRFHGRHAAEQLRDLRGLQLACRFVKLKQPSKYFSFMLALKEPVLIEDCLEMTAALAVKEGMASELWERHSSARLSPTQRVAFYRGLIAGIVATRKSPSSGSTQTASSSLPRVER